MLFGVRLVVIKRNIMLNNVGDSAPTVWGNLSPLSGAHRYVRMEYLCVKVFFLR